MKINQQTPDRVKESSPRKASSEASVKGFVAHRGIVADSHTANQDGTKRMALYARVSTEEQTKGTYPSCDSQIEELELACQKRGWTAHRVIRDEGYTAATLRRPGLSELRWLVQSGEIDGILCTWYDRLTRSREFYTLDAEFRQHGIEFVTLHDAADTRTAAGRFMESMIVAAKTYERDQISEKVRTKMRMRLEKGLHQGGLVPFGFTVDSTTKMLHPDQEKAKTVEQLFRIYVDTRSDFAVRDWLQAHQIAAPHGKPVWQVSTIRDLLSNRRYIGEIEINRQNKDLTGLSETDLYHVVQAPHEPLIPRELFHLAQSIRQEKATASTHRVGRPRSSSQTRCGRVYPLQGILTCGHCSHAMTPWYVHHKPGKGRTKESFIHYYVCALQQKAWKQCDHKNLISARVPEQWIVARMQDLITSDTVVERALAHARAKCEQTLQPQQGDLAQVRDALQKNQAKTEQMLEAISSGRASGALLEMMSVKANALQVERERLLAEQRGLLTALQPLEHELDANAFRETLHEFTSVMEGAEPDMVQKLLRVLVHRIEWLPEGGHRVEYFYLPQMFGSKSSQGHRLERPQDWFQTFVRSGGPDRIRTGDLLRDRQTR